MSHKKDKLPVEEMDVEADLDFLKDLEQENNMTLDPEAREMMLCVAYTIARDKLLEAKKYANFANKKTVDKESLQMTVNEGQCKPSAENASQLELGILPKPKIEIGLLLPSLRHCQVGPNPVLIAEEPGSDEDGSAASGRKPEMQML